MANEQRVDAAEERFRSSVQRLKYLLIASAGASLGFALARSTPAETISLVDYFWLAAVCFWGLSLVTGIFSLQFHNTGLALEYHILRVETDLEAERQRRFAGGVDDRLLAPLRKKASESSRSEHVLYYIQQYALLSGAALYGAAVAMDRFGILSG